MSADRAYGIVNLRTGGSGSFQPHVRVHCSNCTTRLEFACVNSRPPEVIAKTIRSKGWEFVLENRRYTRCPECIRLRDASRSGESPGPKVCDVELFGRTVSLPAKMVPAEALPPPPPPQPVPEPRIFRSDPRPRPPTPTPALGQRYRIEMTSERDIADLITALKDLGNPTMITLITEQAAAAPASSDVPFAAPRNNKSVEHIAKIRTTMAEKSKAYTERVRNALQEIRCKKTNGREPSLHDYVKNLTAMGVEPFRPGRPWSAAIVQKHLDSMDSR